jgi:tetratricopeptide (TPR) repeat protein
MNFPLPNSRVRLAVLFSTCILALFLCYFGLRNALATYYLNFDTRSGYQHAVRFEPANSRNWFFLGRSYLYDFEEPDAALAVQNLRKAVALDPYSAEALLDLAIAYDGEGDTANARTAFLAAQRVYPLSADAAWRYGNFLLRQGEQDAAFRQIRQAVELDPKRAAEAFSVALRVQPDARILLDRAIPSSTSIYLPILHSLSAAGDLENAQIVWNRLISLQQKVSMADMVAFIDEFFRQRRIAEGAHAWSEAVSMMKNPPPPDPADSLIWDGSFESGYSGGGFAWHFIPVTADVQIAFDPSEKHSGTQSLRLLFNGHRNLSFEDACHNINPVPGQRYLLSAWVKTQQLTSSEGIRLQVFVYAAGSNQQPVVTEEVHGTQPWKQLQLSWVDPPGAEFGSVCVKRYMSGMPGSNIQGAAWIDDVSLVPANEDSPKP